MSEQDQRQPDSSLHSERGTTTIQDAVVSRIVGVTAQEVEGVHMGGSVSRGAGGLLERVPGSASQTRGVSVQVGKVEAAIDLTMGLDYGKNILETTNELRRTVKERVESLTGLQVTELNVTIDAIIFPDEQQGRSDETEGDARTQPRTLPRRELRPGASERDVTEVSPTGRTHTESASDPVPEEEVHVEGRPLEEDETVRLTIEDDRTQEIEKRRISEEDKARQRTRGEEDS
jgi:uncharacterized alkaline shock family protein YloU